MDMAYELNLAETREKLRHWGIWYNSIISMGLGFTDKSLIGQLIDAKGELIKSSYKSLVPENQEAETIDALIIQLAETEFEKARVLGIHYALNVSSNQKIQKSNLPRTTYFRYLTVAEEWLSQRLP